MNGLNPLQMDYPQTFREIETSIQEYDSILFQSINFF